MRYGSVCSGIEAATEAWHPLGWEAAFYSEIEPFPCHVLHEHYSSGRPAHMPSPDAPGLKPKDRKSRAAAIKAVAGLPEHANGVPNHGDMTQFEEWPDHAIDLLVGGTPCQSYSVAGLRKGLDDPRGDLMLTYAAIARRYRPRWLVWENVFGVLSSKGGRDFASLLGLLSGRRVEVPADGWKSAGIVEGYGGAYGLAWRVFDTQYVRVDGAPRALPQRRRRVFVVGHSGGDWRRAAAVLFEREGMSGHPAPRRETRKGTAGPIGGCPDGGSITGTVSAKWSKGTGGPAGDEAYKIVGLLHQAEAPPPLTGNSYGDHEAREGLLVAHSLRPEGCDASEDGTGRGTPLIPEFLGQIITSNQGSGGNRAGPGPEEPHTTLTKEGGPNAIAFSMRGRDGEPMPEVENGGDSPVLRPAGGGSSHTFIAFSSKDRGADASVGVSPTLRAMGHGESHPNAGGQVAIAFDTTQITSKDNYSSPKEGDPCHPLAAGAHAPAIAFTPQNDGSDATADLSPTLRVGSGLPDRGEGMADCHPSSEATWAVRRLTPTECARLQGFPDNHCRIPWRGKPAEQCPDGPQYKAYGNSMSTNVMRWLGERIEAVDQIQAVAA